MNTVMYMHCCCYRCLQKDDRLFIVVCDNQHLILATKNRPMVVFLQAPLLLLPVELTHCIHSTSCSHAVRISKFFLVAICNGDGNSSNYEQTRKYFELPMFGYFPQHRTTYCASEADIQNVVGVTN